MRVHHPDLWPEVIIWTFFVLVGLALLILTAGEVS